MDNRKFFPPKDDVTHLAEIIKDLLVKAKVQTSTANEVKKALIGFFADNAGAWGLVSSELVMRQVQALDDAFGVSPKTFRKQVLEMIEREREERETLFRTSANGSALEKSFKSFDF